MLIEVWLPLLWSYVSKGCLHPGKCRSHLRLPMQQAQIFILKCISFAMFWPLVHTMFWKHGWPFLSGGALWSGCLNTVTFGNNNVVINSRSMTGFYLPRLPAVKMAHIMRKVCDLVVFASCCCPIKIYILTLQLSLLLLFSIQCCNQSTAEWIICSLFSPAHTLYAIDKAMNAMKM